MPGRRRWAGTSLCVMALHLGAAVLPFGAALAQPIDIDPPVIELERLETGMRGEAQVFAATVTDNVAVTEVNLHYRNDPTSPYTVLEMTPVGGSDIYSASVSGDETDTDLIQYYIEARDEGKNRVIRGFAFDPLERRLEAAGAPIPAPAPTTPEPVAGSAGGEGMSLTRKIIYGALGLLVVGAIVAAADSGGDDDGGGTVDPPAGDDIPVTITVDPVLP